MRFAKVDIPWEVIHALEEGTLAVFSGAGVSMPPPSNLPSFHALADEIGSGAVAMGAREPIDRYLGRLQTSGVDIHGRAFRSLSRKDSRPSSLHHNLVRLFRDPASVRIVTTNFDEHFEAACESIWSDDPVEVHAAPALPVGSRVSGIVHVHGSIANDPQRMVLSDADFGQAYLTEGWARRFLSELFRTYTVLFVGYSHEDVIAMYLARGLPAASEKRRFALAPGTDSDLWRFLGIELVKYDPKDHHSALQDALGLWAKLRERGALDHEREVESILSRPADALNEADSDYLLYCLRDPGRAQFFYRHAKAEWLEWARNRRVLDPLFAIQGDASLPWPPIGWFAGLATGAEADRALQVAADAGGVLVPQVAIEVVRCLWRLLGKTAPSADRARLVARWLPIVLHSQVESLSSDMLTHLLNDCDVETDRDWAIPLFDHLTRPRIRHERSFARLIGEDAQDSTDPKLEVLGDAHWLLDAWRSQFGRNLEMLAGTLLPVVRAHLERAHVLMKGLGRADENWDLESYQRAAIAPNDEDEFASRRGFNVLIDAGRDLLEWYVENKREAAPGLIASWMDSASPLIQRIGLHALHRDTGRSTAEKIRTVLDGGWLTRRYAKAEVFALLRDTYPKASRRARKELLSVAARAKLGDRRISRALVRESAEDRELGSRVYEYYNLLIWLQQSDKTCDLARRRLTRVKKHFPEFEPREHPDLIHYSTGGFVRSESPVSPQEIASLTPEQYLRTQAELRSEADPAFTELNDPVDGFLRETARVVAGDFAWSIHLAEHLLEQRRFEGSPWTHLIRGWNEAKLGLDDWRRLVALLLANEQLLQAHSRDLSDVVEDRLGPSAPEAEEELVILALGLAARLWAFATREPQPDADELPTRLQTAVNRTPGKLALFAVRASSLLRKTRGSAWREDATLSKLLEEMTTLREDTAFARVVLASQLHFFFDADSEWTRERLLPLFDWDRSTEAAAGAWDGFLFWGRHTPALWSELRRSIVATFEHLDELGEIRSRFAEILAYGALAFEDDPVGNRLLPEYLQKATPEDRVAFARRITNALEDSEAEIIAEIWQRWLLRYLQHRLDGAPPLEDEEWAEMLEWPLHLRADFESAVDLIARCDTPPLRHSAIFRHLADKSDQLAENPDALARYLLHLLGGVDEERFWEWDEVQQVIETLIASPASRELLKAILNRSAEKGWTKAQEFVDRLGETR